MVCMEAAIDATPRECKVNWPTGSRTRLERTGGSALATDCIISDDTAAPVANECLSGACLCQCKKVTDVRWKYVVFGGLTYCGIESISSGGAADVWLLTAAQ